MFRKSLSDVPVAMTISIFLHSISLAAPFGEQIIVMYRIEELIHMYYLEGDRPTSSAVTSSVL